MKELKKVKYGRKKQLKKERRMERKKEFRGKGGNKRKEKKSSSGFKPVRLVLLVFLSVEREGVVGRMVSLFSLPEPHSSLLFSLQSSSSRSFCSPLGL